MTIFNGSSVLTVVKHKILEHYMNCDKIFISRLKHVEFSYSYSETKQINKRIETFLKSCTLSLYTNSLVKFFQLIYKHLNVFLITIIKNNNNNYYNHLDLKANTSELIWRLSSYIGGV
jgi:hypothetical protein